MSESGSDDFEQKQAGTGSSNAETTQKVQNLQQNKNTQVESIDEAAKLNAKNVNSWSSSQTAKPVSVQGIRMPNRFTAKQTVEQCMQGLDAGDADSMYELACHCLDGSISDELVQQITDNKTFKAKLSELARNYANGFIQSDNDSQAFQVFKQAEDYNDPDVLCAIGRCYNYGWGAGKDVAKAIEYYVKAADVGLYEAIKRLEKYKYQNVDEQLKAAFEHFTQQAAAGNANAQFAVAYCYYYEIGVAKNQWLALEMCQATANQQNSNMMVLLGWMYLKGYVVAQNRGKAFELFKQAAETGNKEGQFELGYCYHEAVGVDEDYEQAVLWHEKAAAQGHAYAVRRLGTCYSNGRGVEKDMFKAFRYYKQAAIAGNADGQLFAGNCYKNGKGVQQSYERAVYWLQKAVDQGYPVKEELNYCFKKLGKTRKASRDVLEAKTHAVTAQSASATQQHEIGFLLAKFAAELGCGSAYLYFSYCYYNGISTASDVYAATQNCYKAYQLQPALFDCQQVLNLAELCQNGYVDDRNEIDAFQLLQQVTSMLRGEINAMLKQML